MNQFSYVLADAFALFLDKEEQDRPAATYPLCAQVIFDALRKQTRLQEQLV
jgi:hypothetical protein